ncbi:MAG: glycosyltransferase family 2 protein [Clostridia bacterium]|nr:glycosyltransferase family 2 protein [Clostridia bacterium]
MKYSIVVAVYNEEKSLPIFYSTVKPMMDELQEEYELVFVNDGSTDESEGILNDFASKDARVKVCHFSRNFGQQAALLCGMQHASGEAVIAMDADLQDPPEVALKMIEKWKEGYDIVHGKRRKRRGETVFKRATASIFYRVTRKLTRLDMPADVGDFKLYDRKVVEAILSMKEHDRLLRAQAGWVGFKQTSIEFDRPERVAGTTHYTLKKMLRLAGDGIFPNTNYPLTLSLKLGVLAAMLTAVCAVVFIVLSCFGVNYGGLTAWLFPFIGGCLSVYLINSYFTNVYVYMTYRETQDRPKYVIKEKKNLE